MGLAIEFEGARTMLCKIVGLPKSAVFAGQERIISMKWIVL